MVSTAGQNSSCSREPRKSRLRGGDPNAMAKPECTHMNQITTTESTELLPKRHRIDLDAWARVCNARQVL